MGESLKQQARRILEGESLEHKIQPIKDYHFQHEEFLYKKKTPGRSMGICFSDKKIKFPKNFEHIESRARALHAFANHELLAIEIMALILVNFPEKELQQQKMKKAIIASLHDEQKHLEMYVKRLESWGYQFGDFPLNDYFWRQSQKLKNFAEYFSFMSLTLEAANLDFAHHFAGEFSLIGDIESANLMNTIFEDEVSHVKLGVHFLSEMKASKKLWDYYLENLIFPITPARARGVSFDKRHRLLAGFDQGFIEQLCDYDDGFKITKRKS